MKDITDTNGHKMSDITDSIETQQLRRLQKSVDRVNERHLGHMRAPLEVSYDNGEYRLWGGADAVTGSTDPEEMLATIDLVDSVLGIVA